jgi:quinol-cytochrome oxidoreductase complex cytochrome b subunit
MGRHPPATTSGPAAPGERPPGTHGRWHLPRRVWQSIVLRGPVLPRDDRERAFVTIHTLLLHLRPVKVPASTIRFTHTFGLGGSSLVLITILAVSGILLMLAYQPTPAAAYGAILAIEDGILFGPLVRGIHYWSANLLVVVALLHADRVFLTGGYHGPRQFNWVVGIALLGLVLGNAFTGYLLPWDQRSYWAVTISTGMLAYVPLAGDALQRVARGGADVGTETLVLFYTTHTSIVPALLVVLVSFHFWRVRKAGGVVRPPTPVGPGPSEDAKVMFIPHLLVREAALAVVIVAVVVVLGAVLGAPLGDPANPGMSPNPAKAPWYFMGLQELLVHLHPVVAVLVVPAAAILALLALPYVTDDGEAAGTWWLSERGWRAARAAAIVAALLTALGVVAHEFVVRWWPGAGSWWTTGVLPLVALAACLVLLLRAFRARFRLTPNEVVQTAAILLGVAFAVLTIAGIWFRGPGMALVWPWDR